MAIGLKTRPNVYQQATRVERTKPNTEAPVLPDVAAGHPDAVAACLDRYGGLVWSLARRNCPDQQTAEDAVQDIFLSIWQAAERYQPEKASETTFIAMIARRRLIDLYRRRGHADSVSVDTEIVEKIHGGPVEASVRTELKDEARQAENLLASLPDQQQKVIRMSVYDGLSHSRIAETTGLALGTVKTHIRRGLSDIKRRLFQISGRQGGEK